MSTPLDALNDALAHADDLNDDLRDELIQQLAIQEEARAFFSTALRAVAKASGLPWGEEDDPSAGLGMEPMDNLAFQERVRGLGGRLGAGRVHEALIRAGFAVGIALNASGDALDYSAPPPASYRPALVDPEVEYAPPAVLSREEALERLEELDFNVVFQIGQALEAPGRFIHYGRRLVGWLNARGWVLGPDGAGWVESEGAASADAQAQAERLRDIALSDGPEAKALRAATSKRIDHDTRTALSVEALYDGGMALDGDMTLVEAP